MAKSNSSIGTYVVGQAYAIAVGLIHWMPRMNAARAVQPLLEAGKVSKTSGTKEGVFESLLRGWASELPVQGIIINAKGTITREGKQDGFDAKAAIEERKLRLSLAEKTDKALASLMRQIWLDKDGKWIVPIILGNSGFTRGLSLPNVLLAKCRMEPQFDPATYTVQVVVKEFVDETSRLQEQAFENESRRMPGTTDMNWADRLNSGRQMLESAGPLANENVLRRAFGTGNGQKAYAILVADGRFPQLRLAERMMSEQPDNFVRDMKHYAPGGYIPVASVPQQSQGLRDAEDAEAAEAFIVGKVFDTTGNAPKVVAKTTWEGLAASHKMADGSPMALIAKCHLKGLGFAEVKRKYPELFSADYVGSIGKAPSKASVSGIGKAKAHTAKAKA